MEQFLKLAENYVMQRVMSNHAPLTHANKAITLGTFFAIFVMMISFGCVLAGFYLWLSVTMPQFQALAVFGGALFALSILIFIVLGILARVRHYKIRRAQQRIRDEFLLYLKLAEAEIKDMELIENHPKICLALASLAGFVLADTVTS